MKLKSKFKIISLLSLLLLLSQTRQVSAAGYFRGKLYYTDPDGSEHRLSNIPVDGWHNDCADQLTGVTCDTKSQTGCTGCDDCPANEACHWACKTSAASCTGNSCYNPAPGVERHINKCTSVPEPETEERCAKYKDYAFGYSGANCSGERIVKWLTWDYTDANGGFEIHSCNLPGTNFFSPAGTPTIEGCASGHWEARPSGAGASVASVASRDEQDTILVDVHPDASKDNIDFEWVCATPTPTPRTWTIQYEAVCENGVEPTGQTRIVYFLESDRYYGDFGDAGEVRSQVITNGLESHTYVAMETSTMTPLYLYGTPPHPAIQYREPMESYPYPVAAWLGSGLPEGTYTINFQAPDDWCPTAPLGCDDDACDPDNDLCISPYRCIDIPGPDVNLRCRHPGCPERQDCVCDVAPGCPDPVYGSVKKADGSAAPGALVYIFVKDKNGVASAPLSAVANDEGKYVIDLGNARTQDFSEYFSYSRSGLEGYSEDVFAQGPAPEGTAKLKNNSTAHDEPIPILYLNNAPEVETIHDHTTVEGQEYTYQVEASDKDVVDTLTYRLGPAPDDICGGSPVDTVDFCCARNITQGCTSVDVGDASFCVHPDEEWSNHTCVWDPDSCPNPPDLSKWRCTGRTYCHENPIPEGMIIDPATGLITWSNPTPVDQNQTYHLTVWVSDGKEAVTEEYNLTVEVVADTTPPDTEIVSGPEDGETVYTDTVTFTYTGTDNVTAVEDLVYSYRLDFTPNPWSDWSSATEVTLTDVGVGLHTFFVRAKDEAGNIDSTPDWRSFTRAAALSCAVAPKTFEPAPGETQLLTATSSGGSGNYSYSWSATGGSFVACGDVNCDGEINMEDAALLENYLGHPGEYTICSEWAADVNCDGKMDMGDVIFLRNHINNPDDPQYQLSCCPSKATWQAPIDATDGQTFNITAEITDTVTAETCSDSATATISVPGPDLHHVTITPTSAELVVGDERDFHAQAYDIDGDEVLGAGYSWSLKEDLGTILVDPDDNRDVTFTAVTASEVREELKVTATLGVGDESVKKEKVATIGVYESLECAGKISPQTFEVEAGGTYRDITVSPDGGSGQFSYSWSAVDDGTGSDVGGFDDPTSQTVDWTAPDTADENGTFTLTVAVDDTVIPNTSCSDSATATIVVVRAPTLDISLLMQGRPSYPEDSRGSSGIVDLYSRAVGKDKVLIADDLVITPDGTASVALQGLSVGSTYDFLLKGYIHLTVRRSRTLNEGSNSVGFDTLLVGDIDIHGRDDKVNAFDYEVLSQGWRTTWNNPQACPDNYADCKLADFNLDSKVNAFDYDYIFSNWGEVGNE